jgi:hypothetical protein
LGPRRISKGVAIPTLSISASNTPTSYAATPLPAGLAVNTSTGAITGTPTAAGLTTTAITATNGDGTSAAVSLVWDVQDSPDGRGLWSDIELDLDVDSRAVTRPLVTTPDSGIVLRLLRRDALSLLVGAKKFGVLRDVKPGSEVVSVQMALKEFADENVLQLAGGTPTKVGSGATTRFRVDFEVTEAQWAILSDYEGERRTSIAALAEIELEVGVLRVTSRPFRVEVVRDHFAPYTAPSSSSAPPSSSGPPPSSSSSSGPPPSSSSSSGPPPSSSSSSGPPPSSSSAPSHYNYQLSYDLSTYQNACSAGSPSNYYSASSSLTSGALLYTDTGLTTEAPTGYYSDSITYFNYVSSGGGGVGGTYNC